MWKKHNAGDNIPEGVVRIRMQDGWESDIYAHSNHWVGWDQGHITHYMEKEPMTNYNDGEWHPWVPGECPVHPESITQVRLFDPNLETENMTERAGSWFWHCKGDEAIIAFRVIKEHKEPREFWVAPSAYGHSYYYHTTDNSMHPGAFKVREVMD